MDEVRLRQIVQGNKVGGSREPIRLEQRDALTTQHLFALMSGEVPALYLHNYFPGEVASKLHAWLKHMSGRASVWRVGGGLTKENSHDTATSRLGIPYNEALAPEAAHLLRQYFDEGDGVAQAVKAETGVSPFEQLQADLSVLWPYGVGRRHLNVNQPADSPEPEPSLQNRLQALVPYQDRALSPLLGRYTLGSVPVHCDYAGPSFTNGYADSVVSANLFCSTPDSGGEFCVWKDLDYRVLFELGGDLINDMILLDKSLRDIDPPWRVKPKPGSLLMINTRFLHAVEPFDTLEGRTALQTFMSHYADRPIELWV